MSTYGVVPNGPGVGVVVSGVQRIGRGTGDLLQSIGLNRVGEAVRFVLIPNSTLGGTTASTAAGLTVTAVHNTSPLWMPAFMELTMGRVSAWTAITFFGIPNAPASVLVAAAVGTYILFTSSSNAIQWAFTKSSEQVNEIMEQLHMAVEELKGFVEKKEADLVKINKEIDCISETFSFTQSNLSEYSKVNGGSHQISDPDSLHEGRMGTEKLLRETGEFLGKRQAEKAEIEKEWLATIQKFEIAKQSLAEAKVTYAVHIQRSNTEVPLESTSSRVSTIVSSGILQSDRDIEDSSETSSV